MINCTLWLVVETPPAAAAVAVSAHATSGLAIYHTPVWPVIKTSALILVFLTAFVIYSVITNMTNAEFEHIINHDREAYKALYLDYFKKLYNYGRKFSVDAAYIEDAIQEVFYDLWTNQHRLKEITSINSYLFSSFRYSLFRRVKAEAKTVSSEEFETEPEFAVDSLLIKEEAEVALQHKLTKALKTLTPRQREAIFLRFYQNLSYEEVAAVLRISVKATYKIMARSLSALKENMDISILLLLSLLRS